MKRPPILTPADLSVDLWLRPSTTTLRRRSVDVTAVFLRGHSMEEIAGALMSDVDLIEDSIRWEMQRRVKNGGRRG
jgi:hypothetical protein